MLSSQSSFSSSLSQESQDNILLLFDIIHGESSKNEASESQEGQKNDNPLTRLEEFIFDSQYFGLTALCDLVILTEEINELGEDFPNVLVNLFETKDMVINLLTWAIQRESGMPYPFSPTLFLFHSLASRLRSHFPSLLYSHFFKSFPIF
jgi:hypothetical protein